MKAINLKNIVKTFQISKGQYFKALDGVSFSIEEGSLVVIGGANGSGKSLLMSIIAGLVKATSGFVEINGKIGLVFQDPELQILGETPYEDVAFGFKNKKLSKEEKEEKIIKALESVGLVEKKDSPSHSLSGGEKRRLAVASILALDSSIMIFDEPYSNMDYFGVCEVNSVIQALHESGKTVVVLTHELEKVLGLSDRFIALYQGRCVYDGAPEGVLEQNLTEFGIKNPLVNYNNLSSLKWIKQ
ncbi:MAG: ABC transporter ATP-binding protein [Sphaerochaetaceae bacterium]|nr:ABC transporter ATP-binding protein [Sphaerochaetaceae bacterium]